jgi:hypothetical protein
VAQKFIVLAAISSGGVFFFVPLLSPFFLFLFLPSGGVFFVFLSSLSLGVGLFI